MMFHRGWVDLEKILLTSVDEMKTKTRNALKCIDSLSVALEELIHLQFVKFIL